MRVGERVFDELMALDLAFFGWPQVRQRLWIQETPRAAKFISFRPGTTAGFKGETFWARKRDRIVPRQGRKSGRHAAASIWNGISGLHGAKRAPESNWRDQAARSLFPPIERTSLQLPTKTADFKAVFQCFGRVRSTESSEFMERAMGIEPTSEAWEVLNFPIPFSPSVMLGH